MNTKLDLASGEWATQSHVFDTRLGKINVIEDCDAAALVPTPARTRRFAALTAEELELARAVEEAGELATTHRGVSYAVVALSIAGYLN